MGWPCSETSRQPLDPKSHRMATTERGKITRKTDTKMARRYRTMERNQLGTRCQTAGTMAGQCGGLHLAVDEQSLVGRASFGVNPASFGLKRASFGLNAASFGLRRPKSRSSRPPQSDLLKFVGGRYFRPSLEARVKGE
ncbi:hypothetical protein ElyMa_001731500 [Elysia marginata]|uniref:Uncharacterized protein n=1 Tax=Elysia marginata TaxID=1093978 RepID=A0AAV4K1V2_9GAST|nr:hypothetical protein ElyMa_001731500 [Elysia marginata]